MNGPIAIGPYTVGEVPAPIVVTFRNADGTAMDLSNVAWVARWIYRRHKTGTDGDFNINDPAAITQNATVDHGVGATKGQCTYVWVAADFLTEGDYEGELWIGNSANRFASERFTWTTRPAILVPLI
jgi:hypothetical protein